MKNHRFLPALLAFASLVLPGCMTMKCPPCPPAQTLPGKDFATPENAFEYLREAIVKGQTDDSFAWHEFQAMSEQMKKDKKITREDYFFARKDVVKILKQRIGPLESVRVVNTEYLTPARDRAALTLEGSGQSAKAIVVREITYDIEFRDKKKIEPIYGVLGSPSDLGEIKDGQLFMKLAIADALKTNPGLTLEDIYEVKYSCAWRFYDIEGSNIPNEIERIMKDRPPAPAGPAAEQPKA
jgi:hypothetical protein